MKIYRVSYRLDDSEHTGYEYFSNKAVAEAKQKQENKSANSLKQKDDILEIEFELTKKGILELLNSWASHPDNG